MLGRSDPDACLPLCLLLWYCLAGLTVTMSKPGDFQNMLTAVPYPQKKTGFKDPADPCNRSDKRNGGDYRRFER